MEFDKVKALIRDIGLDSTRTDTDDYMEVVVRSESMDRAIQVLESIFGKSAWPSQNKLSKDIQKLADNAGGLRKGQTLFFLNKDGVSIFAMLWPWQDAQRTTIKIGIA